MKPDSKETGPPKPSDRGCEPTPQTTAAELSYIVELLGELNQMADRGGYPMLSYFIELARLEAAELTRKQGEHKAHPCKPNDNMD